MPPAEISLAAVMEAIEGPIYLVECTHDHHNCDRDANCTLKIGLDPIQQQLATFLKGVTLAEFSPSPQGETL